MARRDEIIKFGCEEHDYDTRTICRWLTNLKENRRQGQPRKQVIESSKDLDAALFRMIKSEAPDRADTFQEQEEASQVSNLT